MLVVADREVALPLGVGGVARGERARWLDWPRYASRAPARSPWAHARRRAWHVTVAVPEDQDVRVAVEHVAQAALAHRVRIRDVALTALVAMVRQPLKHEPSLVLEIPPCGRDVDPCHCSRHRIVATAVGSRTGGSEDPPPRNARGSEAAARSPSLKPGARSRRAKPALTPFSARHKIQPRTLSFAEALHVQTRSSTRSSRARRRVCGVVAHGARPDRGEEQRMAGLPRRRGSTAYSPLDQINRDNVKNLQVAWTWKFDNYGTAARDARDRRRRR